MKIYHIFQEGKLIALISVGNENQLIKYSRNLRKKLKSLNLSEEFETKEIGKFSKEVLGRGIWAISEKDGKIKKFNN